jgi:hypothetical protein
MKTSSFIKNTDILQSQFGSVRIATGYGLDDRMIGVRFPAGAGIFLFDTMSRPALEPSQPPIEWVKEAFPGGESAGA